MLKLGSYIARAHGTEIGYDNDVPAGSYKGALDLTAVMQEAIDAGKLISSALDMPEYTYVGRFNVWHVSGTVDVSKVIVKDLFLGHEDTSSTGSTDSATDSSATDSTATDATVNTTGGSSGQTTGGSRRPVRTSCCLSLMWRFWRSPPLCCWSPKRRAKINRSNNST